MEMTGEQERLYKRFEQELPEVASLAKRIEAIVGRRVEFRPQERSPQWGLYAPKNFAYARKISQRNCLLIATQEEWAIRANVDKSGDGGSPGGWWGEPDVWWYVLQDDTESRERVAGILARVCQARHR